VGKVAIMMGSSSDLERVKPACEVLEELGIGYEIRVLSAHRTPVETAEFASRARAEGFDVIIAAAGAAAHLPGVVAAYSDLPVIGLPLSSGILDGLDALLSIAQMPRGVPVAAVAVDNAANAALLASRIIALKEDSVAKALEQYRQRMRKSVLESDEKVRAANRPGT
jgi:5-(carboxyamino)imidazole ribonucleotide mutase